MHLHGCHQTSIVRGLSGYLMLNDQALPNRIDRRVVGQQREHAFQAQEFRGGFANGETKAVLGNGARRHYPKLEEVLRNDVKIAARARQCLKGARNCFILRVPNLNGSEKYTGVDEQ